MTLEKHIIDTMKEWQIKIGNFDSNIRLYYPKVSLCRHLDLDDNMDNEALCDYIENYFADDVKYLGNVTVTADRDRFCIMVGKEGCDYVENEVPNTEFLTHFLEVLKTQNMESILNYFKEFAKKNDTNIVVHGEEGGRETVISFENEEVEPYVYCIDKNEFGITYHRFTKEDFSEL